MMKSGASNLTDAIGEALWEYLLTPIPIVGQLVEIKKAAGLVTGSTMLLVDLMTEIDDEAYAASMILKLYYLTNYAGWAAGDFGEAIAGSEDSFQMACQFDEAVRIWKSCAQMLCDFGMEFEKYRLQAVPKSVLSWTPSSVEEANWYSAAISIAALRKLQISEIRCHSGLSCEESSETVYLDGTMQIVTIACPVTVYVKDADGKQVAQLLDSGVSVVKGYEPYFHVMETQRGSGDYMKLCCIPEDWSVSFSGNGAGVVHVLYASLSDGYCTENQIYKNLPVRDGSRGEVIHSGDSAQVILDGRTYGENPPDPVFPSRPSGANTFTCDLQVQTMLFLRGGISVSWIKRSDADGYYVERRVESGDWVRIYEQDHPDVAMADRLMYTDLNVKEGTCYTYRVQAYYRNHTGICYSNYSTTGRVLYYKSPKPPVITKVHRTRSGKSMILKWRKISGVKGYQIQYSTRAGFSKKKTITIKKSTRVTKNIQKLSGKKTYYVRIRSFQVLRGKRIYSRWCVKHIGKNR